MNKLTYIAFAATCLFLASIASALAAPEIPLSAHSARRINDRNNWVQWAETKVKEAARDGFYSVTIAGRTCKAYRSMEARGFKLIQREWLLEVEEACTISWGRK